MKFNFFNCFNLYQLKNGLSFKMASYPRMGCKCCMCQGKSSCKAVQRKMSGFIFHFFHLPFIYPKIHIITPEVCSVVFNLQAIVAVML